MYDDLSRIERSYGSVAEYNRSRMEDEEQAYEAQRKNNEWCKANAKKLEENKNIVMWFAYDCVDCKYYEEVGPTVWNPSTMDIDDVEHGLCRNCNRNDCLVWREQHEDESLVTV